MDIAAPLRVQGPAHESRRQFGLDNGPLPTLWPLAVGPKKASARVDLSSEFEHGIFVAVPEGMRFRSEIGLIEGV
jgi:hypothetical protein